jgi:hypothetical protein
MTSEFEAPPPPYPADTRAKGWRFELDYEQIEQSSTWSSAMTLALEGLPLARPFLLAMWYAAWKQVPCGSLPADDREMAGTIGIPLALFREYRDVLLRGWWMAEDGRLYHDTLVTRALEMMRRRRSDSDRQAAIRAKKAAESHDSTGDVTSDTSVNPAEVGAESSTDNRIPTTSSSPASKKKARAAPAPAVDRPADVDETVWRDWLSLRKAKKAPVSPTVLDGAVAEAAKAGMSLEAFLRVWCTRGTQGLQADWLKPHERQAQQQGAETPRERAAREKVFRMTGGMLGAQPYGASNDIIDITPAALG